MGTALRIPSSSGLYLNRTPTVCSGSFLYAHSTFQRSKPPDQLRKLLTFRAASVVGTTTGGIWKDGDVFGGLPHRGCVAAAAASRIPVRKDERGDSESFQR